MIVSLSFIRDYTVQVVPNPHRLNIDNDIFVECSIPPFGFIPQTESLFTDQCEMLKKLLFLEFRYFIRVA